MKLRDKIIVDNSVLAFAEAEEIMEMAQRCREAGEGKTLSFKYRKTRFKGRLTSWRTANVLIEVDREESDD